MQSEAVEKRVDRRTFLTYVIGAVTGFISAVVGIPLAGSLVLPTLRQRPPTWVTAGAAAGFPIGKPTAAEVSITSRDGWMEQTEAKGVWVVRHGEDSFTVFNGRCTHLGCAYSWEEEANEFGCPCHGGRYSRDGRVQGGPPPRQLDTLGWRVEAGNLLVEYQDFRLGITGKETT